MLLNLPSLFVDNFLCTFFRLVRTHKEYAELFNALFFGGLGLGESEVPQVDANRPGMAAWGFLRREAV